MSDIRLFTKEHEYTTMLQRLVGGTNLNINNHEFAYKGDTILPVTAASVDLHRSINTAVDNTAGRSIAVLNSYMAPTTLALDSMDSIGKEFDDILKDTFLTQMYNIKGTDILCSVFCLVVSMLPCKTRNDLYESIQQLKRNTTAMVLATDAVNELVKTFNATMTSVTSLVSVAETLFGSKGKTSVGALPTGQNLPLAIATIASAQRSIESIVKTLRATMKVLEGGKVTSDTGVKDDIWNLSKNSLFAVQGMAMQLADEMMDKIFGPIEKLLREYFFPGECATRGQAAILLNKILAGIAREKTWIFNLINEFFTAGIDFRIQFTQYNQYSRRVLELRATLQALHMVVTRFGDLAISCGVWPCNELSDEAKSMMDSIRNGKPFTPIPASLPQNRVPRGANIEELASRLAPMINAENVSVDDENITSTYNLGRLPKILDEAVQNGLLSDLGEGYQIITGPETKVIYTFKRMCGE